MKNHEGDKLKHEEIQTNLDGHSRLKESNKMSDVPCKVLLKRVFNGIWSLS